MLSYITVRERGCLLGDRLSRELTLQSHQLADFVLGDFSENEPRHQGSVSYIKIGDEIMLSSMMYQ